MEKDWPTLVVGGLFFLIGLSLCGGALWAAFGERLETFRLQADGATARAEVLRKRIVADRTQGSFVRPKHRVEYRFVPMRGEAVIAEAGIDAGLWQRLGEGEAIEVFYRPADPDDHRVEGATSTGWVIALVLSVVGGFFAIVGFWLARNGLRGKEAELPNRAIRWINDNPPLALGSIGVAFFLIFAAAGAWWAVLASEESAEFAARAQAVEGTVISKDIVRKSRRTSSTGSSGSSHSTHYHVTYRYAADGVEMLGTSELDSGEWDRLKERGPIAVTYVGGSPWKHRVGDEGGVWLWIGPVIFLGVGGGGMLGSAYALRRGWLRRGAPPPPQAKARPVRPVRAEAAPAPPAKRGGNWIVVLVGAAFFLAGGSLAVAGLLDLLEERRFDAGGQLADASIVDKSIREAERSERRSTAYTIVYRFTTKEAGDAGGRAILQPAAWEKVKPGDSLRVQYLPERPEANRPLGENRWVDAIVGLLVGPLFALIGAFILFGAWLNRREPNG